MTIWKIEGREANCEIFTARGSKGGKRNPKLRYFLQLVTRQGEQRIQIRISKEEADDCMALRAKAAQVDWCAEKSRKHQIPAERKNKKDDCDENQILSIKTLLWDHKDFASVSTCLARSRRFQALRGLRSQDIVILPAILK